MIYTADPREADLLLRSECSEILSLDLWSLSSVLAFALPQCVFRHLSVGGAGRLRQVFLRLSFALLLGLPQGPLVLRIIPLLVREGDRAVLLLVLLYFVLISKVFFFFFVIYKAVLVFFFIRIIFFLLCVLRLFGFVGLL